METVLAEWRSWRDAAESKTTGYLNSTEAAAYLRKSRKAFYSWCERHNLKKPKGSRRLLFTREQLDAALAGETQPPRRRTKR